MPEPSHEVTRMTASDVEARRKQGEPLAILDVRRREAWSSDPARIPGAIWVPLDEVPRRARELPADAHLVVYCS
jgi:rhodanese-related sulfurtransferase